MSFKEVKELRKSGKLTEALELAERDMASDANNIWNKRSIAWVYHDYLKEHAKVESFEQFVDYLGKLKSLELPDDERMVFDTCSYQIGKLVFAIHHEEHPNFQMINDIFEIIKDFHFTKHSESYSFLYKAFHKGYKVWGKYLEFADWWGFENFRSEDFLEEKYNDKKNMSLVEQGYIAYSKRLLEGEPTDHTGFHREINREKINDFLPKLEHIVNDHPEYQYPPYFKAKLLLALGDKDDVLSAFLPFAKKKRNDFWVWDLMSDVFPKEDDRRLACLCQALSLKTPDEFLIHTREKLIEVLIPQENHDAAKYELDKIVSTREKNGWKTPGKIKQWLEQDWYKKAKQLDNNYKLYRSHKNKAIEILFSDIPEETVIVEFVNSDKKVLNFIASEQKYGFFKFDRFFKNVEIGDTLKIRIQSGATGEHYKIYTARISDDNEFRQKFLKDLDGEIRIPEGKSFGFLDNAFIHPTLVSKRKLENGMQYQGKAIKSYNSEKKQWGWKLI